jgi:hypothetical protein
VADDRAKPEAAATSGRLPGDALLHPGSLAALGLLLVNDHVLKATFPGPITGKLSDVAGVVLFPILLWSAAELTLALALGRRWRGPSERAVAAAITASTAIVLAIKTIPAAAIGAGWLLGLAQWSLSLPLRLVADTALPPVAPASIVVDPTDLIALPFVAIAIWIGRSRLASARRETPRRRGWRARPEPPALAMTPPTVG